MEKHKGITVALITTASNVFSSVKGLCVLCAQRQKRKIDQEGKGGVKGG